eukprot:COSAG06_NODE_146_length_22145_cov_11.714733_11_plen_349_part_00
MHIIYIYAHAAAGPRLPAPRPSLCAQQTPAAPANSAATPTANGTSTNSGSEATATATDARMAVCWAQRLLALVAALALPPVSRSCSSELVGCYKDQAAPRTLRFHLDGCPTKTDWGAPEPPMPTPSPKCDPKQVSIEYCATQCAQWNPWAGSTAEFFVGLESGIGVEGARPEYAECLCDDVAHGPEAVQILAGKPAAAAIACPAKCPGAEPGGLDQCGGAPGTWALNIYRVNCGSAWGLPFLIALAVLCAGYVVGGIGWSVRVSGAAPGLHAHPHFEQWGQLGGLVKDGALFTKARLQQGADSSAHDGGGLKARLTAEEEGVAAPAAAPAPVVGADDETSDGDEDLVE